MIGSGVTPCLWFDGQAEAAAQTYTSIFPNSRIDRVHRSAADNPSTKEGDVITVDFTLDGTRFMGLNGGPGQTFSWAVSFSIDCADQVEIDRYWEALVADGGEHSACGWLQDRFGVWWQVVPQQLPAMLDSPDRDAARRAMEAMLKMQKLDIAELRAAFEGAPA